MKHHYIPCHRSGRECVTGRRGLGSQRELPTVASGPWWFTAVLWPMQTPKGPAGPHGRVAGVPCLSRESHCPWHVCWRGGPGQCPYAGRPAAVTGADPDPGL